MDYIRAKKRLKLLLLSCLLSFGTVLYAQGSSAKISINRNNISIKEALQEVEKQSNMSVAYNETKLNGDKQLTLNMADQPLTQALDAILNDTGFGYQLKDEHIMIVSSSKNVQEDKKIIRGRVIDESGDMLIGASITIRGTTTGTITDIDGRYTLSVSKGDVLTFSYLGYIPQTRTVGDGNVIDVIMYPDAKELEAAVVTALGIRRSEKALSYNVQQISEDEILRNKDVNFVNALSGKVAGLTINSSSSGIGGASKVIMRGQKGIEQSSNALYVIDGIPMFNFGGGGGREHDSAGATEAIADINPEDIESMSVLTGAAAAALYGNQAANGAILITTKKGKAGRTNLTISQSTEFLNAFIMPKFQNRYGTGSSLPGAQNVADRSWGRKLNASNYMGYSPKDDYFKTGIVTTESFTLSTGTANNQTYLSSAAVNSAGIIPNNDYDRYNFTMRNTTSFLNDKMTLDLGASYIKQTDKNMTNQGVYSNPLVTAYLFPRGDDWNDIKMFERYDTQRKIYTQYWPQGINEHTGQNPYWINYRNMRVNKKDRYMMNGSLSYDILDWLNVAGRLRIDNSVNDFTEKFYATTNTTLTDGSNNGLFGLQTTKNKQLYADFLVNINKTFMEDYTLQANIGTSLSDMREDMAQVRGPILDDPQRPTIPNKFGIYNLNYQRTAYRQEAWVEQTQAVFASVELGYKSTYYLTLTARNDWPSQLAGALSSKKSFLYPSVGTSIILSEVLNLPEQVSYLKIRGSFASVGLPFARFLSTKTYAWEGPQIGFAQKSHYPISNLKPERTDSWEIGITARLFRNFHFDASLYQAKSYNQTFDAQLSVSSLYKNLYVQTGSVQNRGVELALGYDNRWTDFRWATNFTLGANKNKITELVRNYKHPETGQIIDKNELDIARFAQTAFILKEGGSLGDLYSYSDLQRDSNGDIYVDQNGNVVVDNQLSQHIKLGSVFPKSNMAWRNDFSWRNINLGFLISARLGGIVYSATQANMDLYGVSAASAAARDKGGVIVNGGDILDVEKWYTTIGASHGIPQYYTYSATNVRLQEASLGYTFNKSQLWGVAETTISLIGRNLLMIYNKAPFDPESVATTGNYYQGVDYFMIPNTRNIGFNVRVKF